MPINSRYLFVVSMDVAPEKEALFNEVYNTEHCPMLLQAPGVISASRLEKQPLTMILGGRRQSIEAPDQPKYHAIYEISDPSVLTSPGWSAVVDGGRWPAEVRPYTHNRRHLLLKLTYPER